MQKLISALPLSLYACYRQFLVYLQLGLHDDIPSIDCTHFAISANITSSSSNTTTTSTCAGIIHAVWLVSQLDFWGVSQQHGAGWSDCYGLLMRSYQSFALPTTDQRHEARTLCRIHSTTESTSHFHAFKTCIFGRKNM